MAFWYLAKIDAQVLCGHSHFLTCHSCQQTKITALTFSAWSSHRFPIFLTWHIKHCKRQIGGLVNSLSTLPWLGAFEGLGWLMMSVFTVIQPRVSFLTQVSGGKGGCSLSHVHKWAEVHRPTPCSTQDSGQGCPGVGVGGQWVLGSWAHWFHSVPTSVQTALRTLNSDYLIWVGLPS